GETSKTTEFAEWITNSPDSPVVRATPADADVDAWFDVKVIYQQDHTEVGLDVVPRAYLPKVGPSAVVGHATVYAADSADDVVAARGIDRDGVMVVVRPDQYISHILPLQARDELAAFFAGMRASVPAGV